MCNEHIEIERRVNKYIEDYKATYNGVVAYGKTPTDAIESARRKWLLMQEVDDGDNLPQRNR
jgi:S-adenosylmethionine:tRNA-ribosyltransferase-isomerase (queuine synthetase)